MAKTPNIQSINTLLKGEQPAKRARFTPGTPADQLTEINDRLTRVEQSLESIQTKQDQTIQLLENLMKTCVSPPLIVPQPTVQFKPSSSVWKLLQDESGKDPAK